MFTVITKAFKRRKQTIIKKKILYKQIYFICRNNEHIRYELKSTLVADGTFRVDYVQDHGKEYHKFFPSKMFHK